MLPPRARALARPLLPAALALLVLPAAASAGTADLSVAAPLRDGAEVVQPGGIENYTYTVTNNGPDEVEGVLTVTLGDAEQLVDVSTGYGSCEGSGPIVCSLGTLLPGGSYDVRAQVRFTRASSTNANAAQVSAGAGHSDPSPGNDAASTLNPVVEPAEETGDPSVSTGGWSRTQATLKVSAEVTPYGDGELYFEYGSSKRYGKKTKAQRVSGKEQQTVRATIAGLEMGAKVHYRAVLVVGGKTLTGKDVSGTTMGKLKYGPFTLKAVKRTPTKVSYTGKLGGGYADAPGACQGTVMVLVYVLDGGELLKRTTKLKRDCTYAITVPFGRRQASKYGKRGKVLTQARFSGNKAVSPVGSNPDRP